MAVITGVGIATIDIVNHVSSYPAEDSEVRATAQSVGVGGNSANTLRVLAQFGHRCRLAGLCSDDADGGFIRTRLARAGVATDGCRAVPGHAPTSYILLSEATGSRSIVHYRDLPEFGFDDFRGLPLHDVDWVHFEGRAVEDTRRMLDWLRREHPGLRCSLEVEKPRPGIETLFDGPDLLLFSRGYARSRGFDDGAAFIDRLAAGLPRATLTCAWGEAGAWGRAPGAGTLYQPAFPPVRTVDTLGAGDVFNAAAIHAMLAGRAMPGLLRDCCQLAGIKCGRHGLENLRVDT